MSQVYCGESGRESALSYVRQRAGYGSAEIADAVRTQLAHGGYDPEPIYGDGNAGERIADVLATIPLTTVKRMTY